MIRGLVAILLLSLASPSAALGAAADDPGATAGGGPTIVGVRVGVGGRYKPGCWTPVNVAVRGVGSLEGGVLTLTVPDGDGVPSRFSTPLPSPAPLGEPRDAGVELYARFGRVNSPLRLELTTSQGVLARKDFKPGDAGYLPAMLSEQELVIVVGREPLGVEEAARWLGREPERRTVVARMEEFDQLPTRWYGYEAVDTVVLSTSDPTVYAGLAPDDSRLKALDRWLRLGGKLVLCAGEHAEELLGAETALGRFVPGRIERVLPIRETEDYKLYAGSAVRIPLARDERLRVPLLTDVEGKIEAADRQLPLVVRGARGFGQVAFIAADLDRPPFSEWEDRRFLTGKLLGYPATPADEDDEGTAVMHFGYTDLAGQLRSALDRFPQVWVVPFWMVVGLIVLYVLAIGPGDYFLLRKVAGRMQLTWITFPLIVIAFGGAAYVLAHRLKGDRVRVNEVDLVDVDVESGRVRGTAWANVFSPRLDRYDLAFVPRRFDGRRDREASALTAWLGLPGDALGGMNPSTVEPAVWRAGYRFSPDLDALAHVPIQPWSTKSLTGRWTSQAGPAVEGRLVDEDGVLVGTLTSRLPFPLFDCLLAYGFHAYELEGIEPGATVELKPRSRRELKSLLTGRQIVFHEDEDDYRPQVTPYDQASSDVTYVLRAMMFYEKCGGRAYTGLSNRYQGFVDLSHLLDTQRAVLVGRALSGPDDPAQPGAELLCDGRPVPAHQVQHTVVYRFVLPVEGWSEE